MAAAASGGLAHSNEHFIWALHHLIVFIRDRHGVLKGLQRAATYACAPLTAQSFVTIFGKHCYRFGQRATRNDHENDQNLQTRNQKRS